MAGFMQIPQQLSTYKNEENSHSEMINLKEKKCNCGCKKLIIFNEIDDFLRTFSRISGHNKKFK